MYIFSLNNVERVVDVISAAASSWSGGGRLVSALYWGRLCILASVPQAARSILPFLSRGTMGSMDSAHQAFKVTLLLPLAKSKEMIVWSQHLVEVTLPWSPDDGGVVLFENRVRAAWWCTVGIAGLRPLGLGVIDAPDTTAQVLQQLHT